MSESSLISLPIEQQCIGGLIRHGGKVFAEIDSFVEATDFKVKLHQVLYQVIKQKLLKNELLDKVIIAHTVTSLNIRFDDEIPSVFDYIESISFGNLPLETCIESFRELVGLRIKRDLVETAQKVQEIVKRGGDKTVTDIIAECDSIYNNKVNSLSQSSEPIDLFESIEFDTENLGNKPKDDGVISPYPVYRQLFGDYVNRGLVVFSSRAKSGKSTLLSNILFNACANPIQNVKCLILDTELDTELVQRRILSSISGVNEYFIRTGYWRNSPEMVTKIRSSWPIVKKFIGKISHIYIAGMDIDQIISLTRRWYYKHIGRNNNEIKPFIAFDYIKLTEELGNAKYKNYKDYQIVGQKVDKLKRLASELNCPIITAAQTNRQNEERKDSSKRIDSGSAVGLSDAINALSSKVFLFNKCALDEIAEARGEYKIDATHKLVPLYCRELGPLGNSQERVKIVRDKKVSYVDNFIYYKIENFKLIEIDSLWNLEKNRQENYDIQDGNPQEDGTL